MLGVRLRGRRSSRESSWTRRSWCLSLAFLLVLQLPATAANIEVNGTCTLVDAIDAANNDDDSGGLCPPGGSGQDVLTLTANIELAAIHNDTIGANGLPVVVTDIAIEGGGFEVSRDPSAPAFRFFQIDSGATLRLNEVTLNGGVGTYGGFYGPAGGAVFADFGILELTNSTLSNNSAHTGGAVYSAFNSIVVYNSTISGNAVTGFGGGIGSYLSDVEVINSTFSGNYSGYLGGAIFGGYGSTLSLTNSTVAANEARTGGGVSDYTTFGIRIDFYGSVLSDNIGGDCATYNVHDNGGNFDSDGTCGVPGSISGLDPILADNGGPTRTHALLAGASAIDGAGTCGLADDQRCFARDAVCDSGSFEFGAAPVGGSSCGTRVLRVTGRTVTTAQMITIQQPTGAWDCEAAGLGVSPGDRIRQDVLARPDAADIGGTAIGVNQSRVQCLNQTSGQAVQFVPAGTLTWSCRDEGLVYQHADRVRQTFTGIAD